ncbi:kynurenine 3-monooxygenase [Sporobolomyces salmoneus]|uniref:kynurenine 3-monooxygenase n=1 Tax=Sporobolomyces salmoneus TaxID=183962 RepID=UPI003180A261
MSESEERTALVVGAGLVGTLCSAMLASRGWTVTLLESRPDPRSTSATSRARSINLALSPRGIEALRSVSEELVERVLGEGIEMRGRMVHKNSSKGKGVEKMGQDYGIVEEGEVIRSISRTQLGIELLDHLDGLPKSGRGSVNVRFGTKLVEMDLRGGEEKKVRVKLSSKEKGKEEETTEEEFDFVVGGDGAYSKVRRELMRGSFARFDYKQFYAPHSYLELSIPPGPNSTFSIEPNYLHIWPRGEFMLIALANLDKSFTLTLFAHDETFKTLDSKLKSSSKGENPIVELFRKEFPDALELMGEEALLKSWRENPKDGLITVECSPYHYKNKVLLIGDSAHAMVPFYGQGMNCGFEDVRVLSSILDHFSASPSPLVPSPLPYSSTSPSLPTAPSPESTSLSERLSLALESYTKIRAPSLLAIQQLAHQNYTEMASSVLSPLYLLRLSLDSILSRFFSLPVFKTERGEGRERGGIWDRGGKWESLYRMTTFRCGIAYEEVIRRREWQGRVLERLVKGTVGIVGLGVIGAGWWRYGRGLRVVRVD